MSWRHWNVVLHRDTGYLVAALTVVYAVSGVAVNHTADWNPNYKITRETRSFEPIAVAEREVMVAELVKKLGLEGPPKDSFRSRPEELELFYEGWSVRADAVTGIATIERPRDRFLLRNFNFLHLNHAKGWWTFVADAYAVALAFMAVSGLLIARGRHGLFARGKWWVMAGIVIPTVFVVVLRYL